MPNLCGSDFACTKPGRRGFDHRLGPRPGRERPSRSGIRGSLCPWRRHRRLGCRSHRRYRRCRFRRSLGRLHRCLGLLLGGLLRSFLLGRLYGGLFLCRLPLRGCLLLRTFLLCTDACYYYFFFFPPFFFAVFFAAFFFVAMPKLLLELTIGTALPTHGPLEPVIRLPDGSPDRSNSSQARARQGRDPDGNGHAAAGLRAVRGADEGTVGAGDCTAGVVGAATTATAFAAARFGFVLATVRFALTRLTARFALRAAPAFLTVLIARRALARRTDFFTARFTLARLPPRFALARAADFFFLPAFVAMSILPSV